MIGIEFWLPLRYWNWVPAYSDLSRVYRLSWLFIVIEWHWPGK